MNQKHPKIFKHSRNVSRCSQNDPESAKMSQTSKFSTGSTLHEAGASLVGAGSLGKFAWVFRLVLAFCTTVCHSFQNMPTAKTTRAKDEKVLHFLFPNHFEAKLLVI